MRRKSCYLHCSVVFIYLTFFFVVFTSGFPHFIIARMVPSVVVYCPALCWFGHLLRWQLQGRLYTGNMAWHPIAYQGCVTCQP